jgi:hypothetical protein
MPLRRQVVASTSLALKFLVQGLEVEQDLEPGEAQALAMKNRDRTSGPNIGTEQGVFIGI